MADLSARGVSSQPLKMLGPIFWAWYADHKDDHWPIKVWVVNYQLKMSQLYPLWVYLFGAETQL